MDASTIARFWSKVNKNGPVHPILGTRCWLWRASIGVNGYGQFKLGGTMVRAHRAAWFIEYGKWPIPNALHHCDTPPCIRPSHLFEGNRQDNMDDKVKKGRAVRGETYAHSKLTNIDVQEIRRKSICTSQRALATFYGVSQRLIWKILQGKAWTHV